MIDRNRRSWKLIVATSVCTAGMLLMAPLALADDGHGGGGRGDGRDGNNDGGRQRAVQVQVFQQTRGEDQNRDNNDNDNNNNANDDNDNRGVAPQNVNVTPLVTAINNEVATLSSTSLTMNNDNDEAAETNQLRVISLGNLVNGLSSADASTVTNAVNGNVSSLQTFLGGGSTTANTIDAALSAAGVNQSNVLAILSSDRGDGRLIVVTA